VNESDPLRELERQVELGALFSHASLSTQAQRLNDSYALLNGLVELLIENDLVDSRALLESVQSVRGQLEEAKQNISVEVAVRVDNVVPENSPVNCDERMHLCHAICCRLRWPLSAQEVENGPLKWDLARPYFNRTAADGYCQQSDPETRHCGVYDQRPAPCQQYTCKDDKRIWKDFEGMVINQEWIDETMGNTRNPIEIYMSTEAGTQSARV
jgi:Fe-S-cluster containining protein